MENNLQKIKSSIYEDYYNARYHGIEPIKSASKVLDKYKQNIISSLSDVCDSDKLQLMFLIEKEQLTDLLHNFCNNFGSNGDDSSKFYKLLDQFFDKMSLKNYNITEEKINQLVLNAECSYSFRRNNGDTANDTCSKVLKNIFAKYCSFAYQNQQHPQIHTNIFLQRSQPLIEQALVKFNKLYAEDPIRECSYFRDITQEILNSAIDNNLKDNKIKP